MKIGERQGLRHRRNDSGFVARLAFEVCRDLNVSGLTNCVRRTWNDMRFRMVRTGAGELTMW